MSDPPQGGLMAQPSTKKNSLMEWNDGLEPTQVNTLGENY
jgi:hypothetical protein